MDKRLGERTVRFKNGVYIKGCASIVEKTEEKGPFGEYFDVVMSDDLWEEESWEKTERKMFRTAVDIASAKAGVELKDIRYLLGGDLLNQIISASFSARDLSLPFIGLYGACSTMSESLMIGGMLIDGGFADWVACATSSHFATAERQYRFPLELGTPKTPTSQRTVTGAGACILAESGERNDPKVTMCTAGKVIDFGVKDANNMGAAMAPAAAETLITHFEETDRKPEDYDMIITGDLGTFGSEVLKDLMKDRNIRIDDNYRDCGADIYRGLKDIKCGGSGCGCGAVMLSAYYIRKMMEGEISRILFTATGALLSPTSSQQGESIPSIAHAVAIEREGE